jgi:hypothetical protein
VRTSERMLSRERTERSQRGKVRKMARKFRYKAKDEVPSEAQGLYNEREVDSCWMWRARWINRRWRRCGAPLHEPRSRSAIMASSPQPSPPVEEREKRARSTVHLRTRDSGFGGFLSPSRGKRQNPKVARARVRGGWAFHSDVRSNPASILQVSCTITCC